MARTHHLARPALALAPALLLAGCMANLRPEALPEDRPPSTAEVRGRALLDEMLVAHGGEAWSTTETLELTARDEWQGLLATIANPWPRAEVDVALRYRVGTFDSRAEFLSGEDEGLVWGLQSWRGYTERTGEGIRFVDNDDLEFILPALQYLFELPYRIQSAELVAYAGTERVGDMTYDVVFATWGRLDGHSEADQYRLYLDLDSRRLVKAQYTVRAFADFASGTAHYDDYRNVDGVWIPFELSINSTPDEAATEYLHKVTVQEAKRNAVPPGIFVADAALPDLGDEKPQMN